MDTAPIVPLQTRSLANAGLAVSSVLVKAIAMP